jgi:hypothetical protein
MGAPRLHPNNGQEILYALDGRDGWARPPIGSPSLVDIDLEGHKTLKGCKIWPTGPWPIKGAFYSDLRKEGVKSGGAADPPGFCHFATWLDESPPSLAERLDALAAANQRRSWWRRAQAG